MIALSNWGRLAAEGKRKQRRSTTIEQAPSFGEALGEGTIRNANRKQRRAMYRCCAFADCDVAFDRCEIHHILPWNSAGQQTSTT